MAVFRSPARRVPASASTRPAAPGTASAAAAGKPGFADQPLPDRLGQRGPQRRPDPRHGGRCERPTRSGSVLRDDAKRGLQMGGSQLCKTQVSEVRNEVAEDVLAVTAQRRGTQMRPGGIEPVLQPSLHGPRSPDSRRVSQLEKRVPCPRSLIETGVAAPTDASPTPRACCGLNRVVPTPM